MVAAKSLVALACAGTATYAKFDFQTLMKLQAMSTQFGKDNIQSDQKVALMEHAGFNDMELFMSKQISAADFRKSMKQNMKDKLIQNILNGGGLDLSNPFIRKSMFGDQDTAEMLTRTTPEPMQSIIRLIKTENTGGRLTDGGTALTAAQKLKAKDYGKALLKKYQYKQFNQDGNAFTENFDEILLATGQDRKTVIKEIIEQSMFENIQDPLDRSLMYYISESRKATDATKKAEFKDQIKSLQTMKIFQGSVPKSSPVTNDNLFAFYRMVNGKIEAADVLNVALGDSLGPISELDFERYFGAPAKQFSCRAHTDVLRVPCGIKLKADECVAAGCCWNPQSGSPSCYHDLYGKIGSGLLRRAWVKGDSKADTAIKNLFVGKQIPTLDLILKDTTPFGLQYNKWDATNNKFVADGIKIPNAGQERDWWTAAKLPASNFETGPNGAASYPVRDAVFWNDGNAYDGPNRPRYGRPGYKWKPHGPTQSPFFDSMPGINPTANPLANGLGTLDEYYRIWLEYAEAQDQATCALIHKSSRVKCMENYEALVDQAIKTAGTSQCAQAGCCFNEDSFLEGGAACYRATDYGTCTNLPAGYVKTECGYEGITENECLTNARCCYRPSEKREDPWCYYKYSATLDENQWCAAWSEEQYRNIPREECFLTKSASNFLQNTENPASNINNLVSKEQCTSAGCCYDASLGVDVLEWMVEGLGYGDKIYRCFQKRNPQIAAKDWGTNAAKQVVAAGGVINSGAKDASKPATGTNVKADPLTYVHTKKTCVVSDWGLGKTNKRSCGENLSYYQCVYKQRCCFKPTVANEPACYRPEETATAYAIANP